MEERRGLKECIIGTNGRCFLCWDEIITKDSPQLSGALLASSSSTSVQSVRKLATYLSLNNMSRLQDDKIKLEQELDELPFRFVKEGQRRKLEWKVVLCLECSSLNERFSGMFRQLERIRLEMTSCLERIHAKLLEAENKVDLGSSTSTPPELKKMEVLRNDAMKKCSRKLDSCSPPRIRIQKMTPRGVTAKKQKLKESLVAQFSDTGGLPFKIQSVFGNCVPMPILKLEKIDAAREHPCHPEEWVDPQIEIGEIKVRTSADKLQPKPKPKRSPDSDGDSDFEMENSIKLPPPILYQPEGKSMAEIGMLKSIPILKTGRHQCSLCLKQFATVRTFETHYSTTHLQLLCKCPVCKKVLRRDSYYRHFHSIHGGIRHNCPDCDKSFSQKGHLQDHTFAAHSGRQLKCKFCSRSFNRRSYIARHMKRCPIKNNSAVKTNSTPTSESIPGHSKPKRYYKCNLCEKKYTKAYVLEDHKRVFHRGIKFRCVYCPQTFTHRSTQLLHRRVCRQRLEPGLTPAGNVRIAQGDSLILPDSVINEEETKFRNAKADKYVDPDQEEIQPVDVGPPQIHFNRKTNKFACQICGVEFRRQVTATRHHRIIHEKIRHKCEVCRKPFKRMNRLSEHYRKSACGVGRESGPALSKTPGPKIHICAICGAGYTKRTKLHIHLQVIHSKLGEYVCDKCDCVYLSQRGLNRHQKKSHPSDWQGNKKEIVS